MQRLTGPDAGGLFTGIMVILGAAASITLTFFFFGFIFLTALIVLPILALAGWVYFKFVLHKIRKNADVVYREETYTVTDVDTGSEFTPQKNVIDVEEVR